MDTVADLERTPTMRSRVVPTLLVAALALTTLGACGGEDDSGISDSKPSSVVRDKDGFTPDQREVADAAADYVRTIVAYQKGDAEADLTAVATPETVTLVKQGVDPLLDGGKKVLIGEYQLTPSKVTIKGETASYVGCADFSGTGIVPEGETQIGPDDVAGSKSPTEYTLIRADGMWKLSDPKVGTGPCPI